MLNVTSRILFIHLQHTPGIVINYHDPNTANGADGELASGQRVGKLVSISVRDVSVVVKTGMTVFDVESHDDTI